MPTLHGFSYSNYYNIPKHALLYKGVAFEEDLVYPSAEGYDAFSPARKVPSLTTDNGEHLSETAVLCEYIEDAYPQKPLLPADPFARNRVRQIMHMVELYLELPGRRLIAYGFRREPVPEQVAEEVKQVAERGIAAMNALGKFSPWVAGEDFTMADIFLYYALNVADGAKAVGVDLDARIEGLAEWRARFADSEVSARVAKDTEGNREAFFAYLKGAMGS